MESIQKTICDYYNIKLGDLKAKRRTKNIAFPRQVAMYLCRKYTETSFPGIGDKFGAKVLDTVLAVTYRRHDDDGVELSGDDRKADYLERLAVALQARDEPEIGRLSWREKGYSGA